MLCVCMYICISICDGCWHHSNLVCVLCTCMYTCMYICISLCVCVDTGISQAWYVYCVYGYDYVYVYLYMHVYTYVCVYRCSHQSSLGICVCAYVCICIRIYMHACMYRRWHQSSFIFINIHRLRLRLRHIH
jgi:hypothetical protein